MKNIFIISMGLLMVQFVMAQTGNVGVGTTTPTAKLHVNGTFKITDGSQGDGKVLTSDASGKGTWQAIEFPSTPSSGSEFKPVSIGCNTWMTKNLNVTKYRDGTDIPQVQDSATWVSLTTGAWCHYNNNPANDAVYGKLYNWYAVNDARGLAPEGWHIPSDFEWTHLINLLGGNNVAGGVMKDIGTTNWNAPNLGATNLSNFSAQAGGYRSATGQFFAIRNFGHWWSSTRSQGEIAWSRNLNYNDTLVKGAGSDFNFGYSVRCVKD